MDIINEAAIHIQPLKAKWFGEKVQSVDMLRLDLVHPLISGNKWFKLKWNVQQARKEGLKKLVSFGGPFSNHLLAMAAAAKASGLEAVGIVRGSFAATMPTETVKACMAEGMKLEFLRKDEYKAMKTAEGVQQLKEKYPDALIIPEGGANEAGRKGAEEIAELLSRDYTHVCVSVGTGTTMAGLRNALPLHTKVIGFAPMREGGYLEDYISSNIREGKDANWSVCDTYHFGGFGRWNTVLIDFMNDFYELNGVPLDMVYTGKMMYGVGEMMKTGAFGEGAKIACVHTGGLQGNSAVRERLLYWCSVLEH